MPRVKRRAELNIQIETNEFDTKNRTKKQVAVVPYGNGRRQNGRQRRRVACRRHLEAEAFQARAHDLRQLVLVHLGKLAPGEEVPTTARLHATSTPSPLPGARLRYPSGEQTLHLFGFGMGRRRRSMGEGGGRYQAKSRDVSLQKKYRAHCSSIYRF